MKNLITGFLVLMTAIGFSQTTSINGSIETNTTKIENMSMTVTVDSAEDLESTFGIKDIKELLETSGPDDSLSFKLICNGEKMANGVKSHISYTIEGNSDDIDRFLKNVEKVRTAALNYYKNKN